MAELLAAQPQFEDPRAAQVYHPLTFGWLCGELIRRVDSRSVGRFFAEEIAGPLDVDVFIGLPAELEPRVSRLEVADGSGEDSAFYPGTDEIDPLRQAVWGNTANGDLNVFPWNSPAFHQAEMPAVNAIGTARGIASIYGALDELVSPAVIKLGTRELQSRFDPLHEEQQRFGLGFELQTESLPLGPPVDGFGHGGAGGSVHGRWPSQKVGFSYAMNLMRSDGPPGDPRPRALLDALYGCL
jgi:CubicO group peptidase (beta-lactamase class C family)